MIKMPLIFSVPLSGWLGVLLLVLLVFQVLTGKGIIKVNFKLHRINGWVILGLAFLHGFFSLGIYLGYVRF